MAFVVTAPHFTHPGCLYVNNWIYVLWDLDKVAVYFPHDVTTTGKTSLYNETIKICSKAQSSHTCPSDLHVHTTRPM